LYDNLIKTHSTENLYHASVLRIVIIIIIIIIIIIVCLPYRRAYVTGAKPYPHLKHHEIKSSLQKGYRMDCPTDCPPQL